VGFDKKYVDFDLCSKQSLMPGSSNRNIELKSIYFDEYRDDQS
jgi:hypothetical protein